MQVDICAPSGLVYGWLRLHEGCGYGREPRAAAALRNIAAPYGAFIGGVGYSRERGSSKGLPPAIFWPLRLPALPLVPMRYSKRSKYGSMSAAETPQSCSSTSGATKSLPSA